MVSNVFFEEVRSHTCTPQLISKPTPPGLTTASGSSQSNAATPPDREAVARVQVRHAHTTAHDARQRGHAPDSFDGWEEPSTSRGGALLFEFVEREVFQGRIDVEAALDLRVSRF